MLQSHKAEQNDLNGHKTALNTKNPPYCTSLDLNKRLTSFLCKAIDQRVVFKQRTRMGMRICTHDQQTGGKEIDQTAASFLSQNISTTLCSVITFFYS